MNTNGKKIEGPDPLESLKSELFEWQKMALNLMSTQRQIYQKNVQLFAYRLKRRLLIWAFLIGVSIGFGLALVRAIEQSIYLFVPVNSQWLISLSLVILTLLGILLFMLPLGSNKPFAKQHLSLLKSQPKGN